MSMGKWLLAAAGIAGTMYLGSQMLGTMRGSVDPAVAQMLEDAKKAGQGPRPSERLAGQWVTLTGNNHLYAAPPDGDAGTLTLVASNGDTVRHRYKILRQSPYAGSLDAQMHLDDGSTYEQSYVLSDDNAQVTSYARIAGRSVTISYRRVDDTTAP